MVEWIRKTRPNISFTIQNVSIKWIWKCCKFGKKQNLQYKMFLLNELTEIENLMQKAFTIQNVSIKCTTTAPSIFLAAIFTIQNVSIK